MKLTKLREAIQEIEFDKEKQEQMILAIQKKKRPLRYGRALRIAAAFAVCILTVGVLSVPVRAIVDSLVLERMEEIPKEEIERIGEQIQSQRVEADSHTREYTQEEKERRGKLYEQYLSGTFPEGELPQVDSEAEAAEYEFCYLTTTSVFYLPADRALTDEEILEQIDFEKKRDYALQEQHAEEIAERKKEEKAQIKEVVASGGITEERAVEIAEGYLQQVFGLDGSGMEMNHYYISEDEYMPIFPNSYGVNWSDNGNHRYYYFFIDAADGTLLSVSCSHDMKERLAMRPAVIEAAYKTASVSEQAEQFLKEKLGIQETYEEVRSYYLVNTESEKVSGTVDVLFVMADGTARQITSTWDGEVCDYSVTMQEDYEEHIHAVAEANAKYHKEETGRDVEIQVVSVIN